MATIHRASVSPTKSELLERLLGERVAVSGTYRFDDPLDEVGVEAFILESAETVRHVVLTYRGAPLADAEGAFVSTMEHSVLGRRWVYDGTGDPVAVACFERALLGAQDQAVEEMWDDGQRVGTLDPTVRLSLVPGRLTESATVPTIATDLRLPPPQTLGPRLRADWHGGDAIVASLL